MANDGDSHKIMSAVKINVLSVFAEITGCAVAPAICVNGDWFCQWERAVFDPLQNPHPLTNHRKIGCK